jgi:hypothetical protein
MQTVINQTKEEEKELYKQLVQKPLNDSLIEQYSSKNDHIHCIMEMMAIENEQKMKLNWLVTGDRPINFFYSKISVRNPSQRSNCTFNSDGTWSSTSEKIANEAIKYFSILFSVTQANNQFPDGTCKKILTENARISLSKPFQLEEIKSAIFQINVNSTPGPHGINSKFYKVHWGFLKNDIWNAMNGIL